MADLDQEFNDILEGNRTNEMVRKLIVHAGVRMSWPRKLRLA